MNEWNKNNLRRIVDNEGLVPTLEELGRIAMERSGEKPDFLEQRTWTAIARIVQKAVTAIRIGEYPKDPPF